ncbi:MAG: hypothetical protein LAN37_12635 [Acidobacteriia bacterium]|nr:hypothetical protein [Terriglobia bacterium]
MRAAEAISTGLSAAWRAKWLVVIFLACQLVIAAAVAAPMYTALVEHIGKSAVGNELAHGFSSAWLLEFQIAYQGFLRGFSIAIVYAGVLFLLLHTVLSAGAFEVFTRGEGAKLHAFGRGVGKYFLRFFRLMVIASVYYFLCFWIFQDLGGRGLDWAFRDSVHEAPHFYLDWLRWALLVFSVVVVSMVIEYAKADMVRDDHASALAALGHGAGFVFSHFGRALTIYLGLGALGGVAVVVYSLFALYFPQSSAGTVFVWFVVAQVLMCFRWMFRLASWAAEVAFYGSHAHTELAGEPAAVDVPA